MWGSSCLGAVAVTAGVRAATLATAAASLQTGAGDGLAGVATVCLRTVFRGMSLNGHRVARRSSLRRARNLSRLGSFQESVSHTGATPRSFSFRSLIPIIWGNSLFLLLYCLFSYPFLTPSYSVAMASSFSLLLPAPPRLFTAPRCYQPSAAGLSPRLTPRARAKR